jgi:FMN phosphatase YigB (HAD superfamily)
MNIRAVILDVYKTMLEVLPVRSDPEVRWQVLARARFGAAAGLSFAEFSTRCDRIIAREHARAQSVGILHPEIFWPDVVGEALPELASLPTVERDEVLFQQQMLFRSVRLMAGVPEALQLLRERGVPLGIASNAQPYTLRELESSMDESGLAQPDFVRELCFWSFEHGFSKPDPHVFRLLTARLQARGVSPGETLMVGDRLDNEIEPARAQGWRTWQLTSMANGADHGDWEQLREYLETRT